MSGCISSASANVLINGTPSEEFELERGLRQGDPLSPFLFLIVADGLNILTKRAVQAGLLKPFEVGRDKLQITHFQYVDDIVFAVEGSKENALALKWMLKILELLSGIEVKFEKSFAFGFNIDEGQVGEMEGFWDVALVRGQYHI